MAYKKLSEFGIPKDELRFLFLRNPYSEKYQPTEFLAAKMLTLSLAYFYLYEHSYTGVSSDLETARQDQLLYMSAKSGLDWTSRKIKSDLIKVAGVEGLEEAEKDKNIEFAMNYADGFAHLSGSVYYSVLYTVYHFNRKPISALEQTYDSLICP